jgi:hypothetical protein
VAIITSTPLFETIARYIHDLMGGKDPDASAFNKRAVEFVDEIAKRPITIAEQSIIDEFYSAFKLRLKQLNISPDNLEQYTYASRALEHVLNLLFRRKFAGDIGSQMRKSATVFLRIQERRLQDVVEKFAEPPLEKITIEYFEETTNRIMRSFPDKLYIDVETAFRMAIYRKPGKEFQDLFQELNKIDSARCIAFKKALRDRFEGKTAPIRDKINQFKAASKERLKSYEEKEAAKGAYLKKQLSLEKYQSKIEAFDQAEKTFQEAFAKLRDQDYLKSKPVPQEHELETLANQLALFYRELGMEVTDLYESDRHHVLRDLIDGYKKSKSLLF